jgi:predicted transposase/invertase (TIGR01784 family)
VRCKDALGRQFIVEMQMYWTESFKRRVLLNASKAYIKQLDVAMEYERLQPVYALNFVNETFEKSPEMKDKYYHHYQIVNVNDTQKKIEGLEFVFVELPKFIPQNRAEKKLQELWLRFLTEISESTDKIPDELLENSETCEAIKYVEEGAYSKEQLQAYDKYRDIILTERSMVSDSERTGMEIGLKQGIEQGVKQGLEQGREQGKEEVALSCLKRNMPLELIEELTGLTKEKINKLRNIKKDDN